MFNIHDSIKPIMSVIMMIVLLAQASAQSTPPEPPIECLPFVWDGEYAGTESQTMYGDQCQKWSSQEPHQHELGVNDYEFPGQDVESAGDYCRYIIYPAMDIPWCYTTNPDVEWEYCDIPDCWTKEEVCISNHTGLEYNGTVSQDIFNNTCLTWSDYDIDEKSNYCRNTDADEEGPWCYIADQGDKIKQYCYIPLCEDVFLDYDDHGNTTYGNDTHDYNYSGDGDDNFDDTNGSGSWDYDGDDSGSWGDNGDDDDSGSWEGDGDDDDSGSWEGDGDYGDDDDSGSWEGDGDDGEDDDGDDDSGSLEENGDGGDYYGGDYYG